VNVHADWRHVLRTILADAVLVVVGIVFYFGIRGLTVGSPETALANAHDVLRLEEQLRLDVEREVQVIFGVEGPLITLANWVYIWGHWPVIVATLVWLALHNRTVFRRLRNAMLVSGGLGLCVYTTYPVAPPRLAGIGLVDTITEQSHSYRVLQPPAFVNPFAAMPSLHVGWNLVVGLAIAAAAGTVVMRTLGRLMPVAMAMATVITANHYLLDVLAGALLGLVGWTVALQLEKRYDPRREAPPAGTVLVPAPRDPDRPGVEAPPPAVHPPAPRSPRESGDGADAWPCRQGRR